MSQQLPRIDLPDLLYAEIIGSAETNRRTLAEEVVFRLWQAPILTAALAREGSDIDLRALLKHILGEGHQNMKASDLQLEFIRVLAAARSQAAKNALSAKQQAV